MTDAPAPELSEAERAVRNARKRLSALDEQRTAINRSFWGAHVELSQAERRVWKLKGKKQ